ncbi:alpha/beta fold hydrolase [Streptomyces sp. NBC_01589]|uniref:alpha/beta hydrolase n=1 Tax=Streptomyces sp. NBC_01589 TaxID=2975886 RepID=UPI003870868E
MDRTPSRDGTLIAHRRRGDGPPVILVGGALSTAATEAPLAELLASRFTVVTYDRRGRGSSGDGVPYAVEREVEDLAAMIDRVGGRAAVFGMSSGGALALEAQAAGVYVDLLAVYEPPFAPDATEPPGQGALRDPAAPPAVRRGPGGGTRAVPVGGGDAGRHGRPDAARPSVERPRITGAHPGVRRRDPRQWHGARRASRVRHRAHHGDHGRIQSHPDAHPDPHPRGRDPTRPAPHADGPDT